MSEQKQLQLLPGGFVACPDCNHDDKIQLVSVTTDVDSSVDPTGELPNVYVVSTLKCLCCDETFELPRIDVRFAFLSGKIVEIDFQNEFVVYTTQPPEQAIQTAKKWYNEHFDYPLGEPLTRAVGTTIYTMDPRDIIIPIEEGE
jgi:frataxin-like iron-binding protein CyaY